MKLAEALQERADLNKKISDLQGRLNQNSLVQEGEIPNEDPNVLMQELEAAIARLQQLIKDINLTNCATIVEGALFNTNYSRERRSYYATFCISCLSR